MVVTQLCSESVVFVYTKQKDTMVTPKLFKFMKKNNLFFNSNAIWQYNTKTNVSTIVFPVIKKNVFPIFHKTDSRYNHRVCEWVDSEKNKK